VLGVKTKFFLRRFQRSGRPKRLHSRNSPSLPTYRHHPSFDVASTATRSFAEGASPCPHNRSSLLVLPCCNEVAIPEVSGLRQTVEAKGPLALYRGSRNWSQVSASGPRRSCQPPGRHRNDSSPGLVHVGCSALKTLEMTSSPPLPTLDTQMLYQLHV
jgi:hypothetical protein